MSRYRIVLARIRNLCVLFVTVWWIMHVQERGPQLWVPSAAEIRKSSRRTLPLICCGIRGGWMRGCDIWHKTTRERKAVKHTINVFVPHGSLVVKNIHKSSTCDWGFNVFCLISQCTVSHDHVTCHPPLSGYAHFLQLHLSLIVCPALDCFHPCSPAPVYK